MCVWGGGGSGFWRRCLPEVVAGGRVCVVGAVVVVVTTTGGRLDFVYVALNPFEVRLLSDLKRTTIVLLLISSGFGMVPPHNLPVMDYTSVTRR